MQQSDNNPSQFLTWITSEIAQASQSIAGAPLLELDRLDLANAQAAPLITIIAEIVETVCRQRSTTSTKHTSSS